MHGLRLAGLSGGIRPASFNVKQAPKSPPQAGRQAGERCSRPPPPSRAGPGAPPGAEAAGGSGGGAPRGPPRWPPMRARGLALGSGGRPAGRLQVSEYPRLIPRRGSLFGRLIDPAAAAAAAPSRRRAGQAEERRRRPAGRAGWMEAPPGSPGLLLLLPPLPPAPARPGHGPPAGAQLLRAVKVTSAAGRAGGGTGGGSGPRAGGGKEGCWEPGRPTLPSRVAALPPPAKFSPPPGDPRCNFAGRLSPCLLRVGGGGAPEGAPAAGPGTLPPPPPFQGFVSPPPPASAPPLPAGIPRSPSRAGLGATLPAAGREAAAFLPPPHQRGRGSWPGVAPGMGRHFPRG
uniref:basic salivary proline-rich protein 2-like n=1 Tax=Euleptes europaea TaxID=460621 RepID=UPI002541A52B|nr:basic salivary proline-rich protein 2-like [Euleptes europaea]